MAEADQKPKSTSLFKVHLALLGIEASDVDASEVELESRRVAQVRPSPLGYDRQRRPERRRRRWLLAASSGLVAAGLAAALLSKGRDSELLTPKGGFQASLYWERAGQATVWTPGAVLRDGDRLRVSVVSGRTGHAQLLAYTAETGGATELQDLQIDEASRGRQVAFPGSLELTPASAHEALAVLYCPAAESSGGPAVAALASALATFASDTATSQAVAMPNGCIARLFRIR